MRHGNAIKALKHIFGEQLSTNKSICQQHGHTASWHDNQSPDAVLMASCAEDVEKAVHICAEFHCPIIPFGVGTSLEGQVNAPSGGLSIDLSPMNKIIEVSAQDLLCKVQAGVTREQLNEYLRDQGLFFPIDPGANATLGGMASTRASGTNAIRYGTMKDNVISLDVVTAQGKTIHTASKARKSSAGYDLTRLFIGAEGTLGIITSLTLKLHGIPEAISGGYCSFPDLDSAVNTVIETIQAGIPVARIELLDSLQVKACNAYSNLNLSEQPTLFLEFHGSESSVKEQSEFFGAIAKENNAHDFIWATVTEERNKLWKARHNAYWAARNLRPESDSISTDVCVPISKLGPCIQETQQDIQRLGLTAPIVGHVGDGNFHVLPLFDKHNQEEMRSVNEFMENMIERTLKYEGTCTGEHGIGQGKAKYLRSELGETVDYMVLIKNSFDPHHIMNPQKIFTEHFS